jgi:N-formylmaleamate deformylase
VAALQKDATCYVVSLAGFGGKPPVKREHLLADARDAIIAYLRTQKIVHPVIVGHSLGGVLAMDIAAKAPDLPGRLIIVDSLPFFAGLMSPGVETEADAQKLAAVISQGIGSANAEQFSQQQKLFIGGMVTSPEQAAAVSAVTGKSDPATVEQAMSELIGRDLRPELPAIKCPVLVLGALADKVDAASTKERVEKDYRQQYKNLPQTRFQFFDHAKHFIMIDDPAGFQAAIKAELALAR